MTKTKGAGVTDITPEEAEDYARRMISTIEDLDNVGNSAEWNEFVSQKILGERGYEISARQADALEIGRGGAIQMWEDVGVKRETPFTTRPTQVRYRDTATGRWTGKTDINKAITTIKGRRR